MPSSLVQGCPIPDLMDMCRALASQIGNAVSQGQNAMQDALKQGQQAVSQVQGAAQDMVKEAEKAADSALNAADQAVKQAEDAVIGSNIETGRRRRRRSRERG